MIYEAYHGTKANFPTDEIRTKAYFTADRRIAEYFAGHRTYEGRVIHADIIPSKPFEIDWMGCSWGGGYFPSDEDMLSEYIDYASDGDPDEMDYWEEEGMCIDMFADYLQSKGYDLLIARNVLEDCGMLSDEYIVMDGCRVRDHT